MSQSVLSVFPWTRYEPDVLCSLLLTIICSANPENVVYHCYIHASDAHVLLGISSACMLKPMTYYFDMPYLVFCVMQ